MSQLSDKILSYAVEKYIPLKSTPAANPPQYGSFTTNAMGALTGGANVTLDTDGPLGADQNSWRLNFPGATTVFANLNAMAIAGRPIADNDYSIGVWLKVNSRPTTASMRLFSAYSNLTTAYPGFFLYLSTSGNLSVLNAGGSTPSLGVTPAIGEWFLYSVIRNSTNIRHYINGVLKYTQTYVPTTLTFTNFGIGFYNTGNPVGNFSASDFYAATSTVIGPTEIAEIYTAGSTAPAPSTNLKYWDGTAWTEPSYSYIWDGVNWQDSVGNPAAYWNGSAWTEVIHPYV